MGRDDNDNVTYQAAYAGGHAYVWKVMLGLIALCDGGRGFGVLLDEHAPANRMENKCRSIYFCKMKTCGGLSCKK